MLAEIHHKISSSGSNLSDRLEDQLTGDFFGAIRYLPFQVGLKKVLRAVRLKNVEQSPLDPFWERFLDTTENYDYELKFWYRHAEGEIDLILEHPDVVIGIEVKYYSGLSSEDDESEEMITPEESCHQLVRYSRLLEDIRGGRSAYLLFLAPFQILLPVEMDMKERSLISSHIQLGFLAWQNVLEQLKTIEIATLDMGQQRIIQDLIDLLVKKGFERFRGVLTGIHKISLDEKAYIFNEQSGAKLQIHWPINMEIQEGNYVYNK
ncbi:NERD domain-containing protein [Paenibacillus chibensis]|uniref:NERD domain-containing protein n=1 Tax=Paenibacillus chibensis TaxID=59846 RepID=UPI0013E315DE|nr:NERD domain-containing protein [Paenibacillus chibensis]MEC0373096.1 NERD domain-containing protein [Paenibacillus chibensis]